MAIPSRCSTRIARALKHAEMAVADEAAEFATIVRDQTLTRDDIAAFKGAVALIDCDLEEVDLSQLDLTGWRFERCIVRRTSFAGSKLEASTWQSCRGGFADFMGADLGEARFAKSDFNNASLRRARLVNAAFDGCKLTGADFSESRTTELSFAETLLINVKLPGHDFRKQKLVRIDLSQADLRKCDFRGVEFEESSLRDANLGGCRFEGADLRGADLGGLRLIDAGLFRGATISRAQAAMLLAELGLNVR